MALPQAQLDPGTQTTIEAILHAPVEVLLAAALFAFGIGGLVLAVAAFRLVSSNTRRLAEDSKQTEKLTELVTEIKTIASASSETARTAKHTDTTVTEVQADVKELTRLQRLALRGLGAVWEKVNALEKAQQKQSDVSGLRDTLEDIKATINKVALSIQQSEDKLEE